MRPEIPRQVQSELQRPSDHSSLGTQEIYDFDWESQREQALRLMEPVRTREARKSSSIVDLIKSSKDDQGDHTHRDIEDPIDSFSYGSIRDQSLYSFLYNVGPTAAMLSDDDYQDLSAESLEFISKIKKIADAQALNNATLSVDSPLARDLSDERAHVAPAHPKPIATEAVIGPYGGSRILSWSEMTTWQTSQREKLLKKASERHSLPQTFAELSQWDPTFKPPQEPTKARAAQKRRLRRIQRLRDYYAAYEMRRG